MSALVLEIFSCDKCVAELDWARSPVCRNCGTCNCPQCTVPRPRHSDCVGPGYCECPSCASTDEHWEEDKPADEDDLEETA